MKKSTLVIIVILLIIVAIAIFASTNSENGLNNTEKNEIKNTQNIQTQQEQTKNEVENTQNENIVENAIENEVAENVTSSETFQESPKTSEEKAIAIVKKDWGENDNTEFSVEGIDGNGSYIVTVRDSQTTQALAFYNVNVTNGTFTKREMN